MLGVLVAQIEDVVHELVLLGIDETAFGALVDQQLDLLAGVHVMLIGGVVAGEAHDGIGDAVEQQHDGEGDAVEPDQRRGRAQRPALGGEDGERFGDELADDDVQRRHDEVADRHADGDDGRLGQAEHREQGLEQLGDGGLAQPAQRQRRQRDAQLAGGQVSVDVLGDLHGVLGARLAFVDRKLELRFADADQRELRDDEERVHDEEHDDKTEANGDGHTGTNSLLRDQARARRETARPSYFLNLPPPHPRISPKSHIKRRNASANRRFDVVAVSSQHAGPPLGSP